MITPDVMDEMSRAARRVADQWRPAVDADDLLQEIALRFVSSPAMQKRFEETDTQKRKSFLVRVGHQVAREMQIEHDTYSGNYSYHPSEVRNFLEHDLCFEVIERFGAEKIDLCEALDNLYANNPTYHAALVSRYTDRVIPKGGNDIKQLSRAVRALTTEMNIVGRRRRARWIEGPGSRSVMSNNQSEGALARSASFDA